jgi:hypothetical protein
MDQKETTTDGLGDNYYIRPALNIYDSLKDTFDPNPYNRNFFNRDQSQDVSFEAINKFSCAFIIGEPGYGKSLLIEQAA